MIGHVLLLIAVDFAELLPSALVSLGITFLIFRKRKSKPTGQKEWLIVFTVPWFICGLWAALISAPAFDKLLDGEGLLFIPFGFSLLTAALISKPRIENFQKN